MQTHFKKAPKYTEFTNTDLKDSDSDGNYEEQESVKLTSSAKKKKTKLRQIDTNSDNDKVIFRAMRSLEKIFNGKHLKRTQMTTIKNRKLSEKSNLLPKEYS